MDETAGAALAAGLPGATTGGGMAADGQQQWEYSTRALTWRIQTADDQGGEPVSAEQLAERGVGPELRRRQDAVIAERLEPILNELGRDGWELVQVGGLNQSARADVRDLLLILKRPKRP
jgi:Domain of unknown function (DUF4177)